MKLNYMEELQHSHNAYPNGVINIDINDVDIYKKYVLDHTNRPYDVIVLFNMEKSQWDERCNHCRLMETNFLEAAASFQ